MAVSPEYRMEVVADSTDVDGLGHVSNLAYLRWVQDVAWAHSRAVGWDLEQYRALGAVFVVRRHEIDYLVPTYAGEPLAIVTWVENWRAASSVRSTRIVRTTDEREIARASTQWVFVAIAGGRPRRIPPEVSEPFLRTRFDPPG